jgi:hypothetical protein
MKKKLGKNHPEKLTSILNEALDRMGLSAGLSRSSVVELWPRIVDPAVAKHAKAEKVTGSALHVNVDSSVWMNELSAVRHILMEKINKTLHESARPITEIRFHQRSWISEARQEDEPKKKPAKRELTDSERGLIRSTVEPVKDPELREVFERLMEKDMQRNPRE